MVDAPGLGPGGATRGGSSPLLGTIVSGFMDLRSAGQARFAIQGTLPCCRALPFRAGCVSLRGAHLRRSAWCLVPLEPFRPALRACGRPCFVTVSDPPPGSRKLARDTLLVSQRGKRVIAPRPRLTSNPAPFAQLLKALLGTFEATVKSTSPASGRSPRGETLLILTWDSKNNPPKAFRPALRACGRPSCVKRDKRRQKRSLQAGRIEGRVSRAGRWRRKSGIDLDSGEAVKRNLGG